MGSCSEGQHLSQAQPIIVHLLQPDSENQVPGLPAASARHAAGAEASSYDSLVMKKAELLLLLQGSLINGKCTAGFSRSPCRLRVLDLAETIWKHQLRVRVVCEARDIRMCWAPTKPSLLVQAAQEHLLIELDGHEVRSKALHNEVAVGGCPQWAITAEVSLAAGQGCMTSAKCHKISNGLQHINGLSESAN